jgi:pimeloyl-ACP methyl ester carboxylesterase
MIRVDGRNVSYLRCGAGPPVVLLHPGPVSARAMLTYMGRLAGDHTVFAFDLPGDGDSDRLTAAGTDMREVADALAATLAAIGLARCPIYGRHTGAALALELGRRRPDLVSGLVLDGACLFTPAETDFFVSARYLDPFEVRDDGSHLFSMWVQVRDIVTWFPWSERTSANRTSSAFSPPDVLHAMFVDRLRAGDGYRDVYAAAFRHDGFRAASELTVPAVFTSPGGDILAHHLDRLPPLRADQRIVRYADGHAEWPDLVADHLRAFRAARAAPPDPPWRPSAGQISRRLVDVGGGQVFVRSCGERRRGRPLVLLHDGRSSSRALAPLLGPLARRRPVFAPDLPGNGASDALASARPSVRQYADSVAGTVAALGLDTYDVYAVGASAGVALELLRRHRGSCAVIDAPDFFARPFARRLTGRWAPPMLPEWDGSHATRMWLMLRDEYLYWPWFDRNARLAGDAPAEWDEFHSRVADALRSLRTYHCLTEAALRYDWRAGLRAVAPRRVRFVASVGEARRGHAEQAVRDAGLELFEMPGGAAEAKAAAILAHLGSRARE